MIAARLFYYPVAEIKILRHHPIMNTARFVQAGFFVTGISALAVVFFGIGGWLGLAVSLAVTMPFSALIMFGMKCKHCGVSYYFEPSKGGVNITGVNMLRVVSAQCRKCGASR